MYDPERLEAPNPGERAPRDVPQVDQRTAKAIGGKAIQAAAREERVQRLSREVGKTAMRGERGR